MVDEAEQTDGALAFGEGVAVLELDVLAAGAMVGVVEVDAVGDGGHGGDGVTGGEVVVDVLGDEGVGVAAGVGGVVPCAVVVDGPVEELEVGVGAYGVEIEEVGDAHAADPELDATDGERGGEREGGALGFDVGAGEADDLVELVAGHVGDGAKRGVADDVEVGEAGEAEGFGDAAAAGGFFVEDGVEGVAGIFDDLVAEEEGADEGGLVFAAGEEGVGAGVGGVEGRVGLEDDVGLAGEEVTGGFDVGEEGDGAGGGGFGGVGFGGWRVRLLREAGVCCQRQRDEAQRGGHALTMIADGLALSC